MNRPALCLLTISAFGPYLVPALGFKFEHLVIYALLLFYLVRFLRKPDSIAETRVAVPLMNIFILLLFILAWSALVTLYNYISGAFTDFYLIIAGMENYVQILAVMTIVIAGYLYSKVEKERLKQSVFRLAHLFIFLLVLNTAWTVMGIFVDLSPVNIYFWAGRAGVSTVAARAAELGRYSGVINQPLEAGLLYSTGLFLWSYRQSIAVRIKLLDILMLILVVIGGALSVSKVFILGGLPLFVVYMLLEKKVLLQNKGKLLSLIPLSLIATLALDRYWAGFSRLTRLFRIEQGRSIIPFYTAGRFGADDSGIAQRFLKTLDQSPFYGLGLGFRGPVDNSYLELLIHGGLVALLVYAGILVLFFYCWFKYRGHPESRKEAKLFLFLTMLVTGAGLGGPTLTANRFAIIFWIFTCLLLQYLHLCRVNKSGPGLELADS